MRLSYKTIIISVLLLVCVIGIASIRGAELTLNFRIEDIDPQGSKDADSVEMNGYVISFPFQKYFVKGTVTIGNDLFKIDQLVYVGTPRNRDNEHVYMLAIRGVDHNSGTTIPVVGEMSLSGDVMKNNVVGYSSLRVYDALLDRKISYELDLLN